MFDSRGKNLFLTTASETDEELDLRSNKSLKNPTVLVQGYPLGSVSPMSISTTTLHHRPVSPQIINPIRIDCNHAFTAHLLVSDRMS